MVDFQTENLVMSEEILYLRFSEGIYYEIHKMFSMEILPEMFGSLVNMEQFLKIFQALMLSLPFF